MKALIDAIQHQAAWCRRNVIRDGDTKWRSLATQSRGYQDAISCDTTATGASFGQVSIKGAL